MPTTPTIQTPRELFPIRTVCSMTGINPITLRAWERRYGFIKPARTSSGHRMYRREDIDLIHRVIALLDKGVSVGQVKKSLQGDDRETLGDNTPWARYQQRMIAAIARFDEDALEDCYNEMLALHPIEDVTQQLLLPLLRELGLRWEAAVCSVSEEHFFAVYLRNKLGARFHHRSRHRSGARVLAACLPGELHEIGLLLFALTAHEQGLRPVLLGANTPLEELALAAKRAQCEAIVLSGSIQLSAHVTEQLGKLVAQSTVPVIVGGPTSVHQRDAIVAAGAIAVGSELIRGIKGIRDALRSA